jgi:hypothetical protein
MDRQISPLEALLQQLDPIAQAELLRAWTRIVDSQERRRACNEQGERAA